MESCRKTGFIKNEEGFTLVETLVATVILILIVTILSATMNSLFGNKKYFKRNMAFYIAKQEIDNTMALKLTSDTLYTTEKPFFSVERKVRAINKVYSAEVNVYIDTIGTRIVQLSGVFYK
jgi:Tfp pilus assembly protein PilV